MLSKLALGINSAAEQPGQEAEQVFAGRGRGSGRDDICRLPASPGPERGVRHEFGSSGGYGVAGGLETPDSGVPTVRRCSGSPSEVSLAA